MSKDTEQGKVRKVCGGHVTDEPLDVKAVLSSEWKQPSLFIFPPLFINPLVSSLSLCLPHLTLTKHSGCKGLR